MRSFRYSPGLLVVAVALWLTPPATAEPDAAVPPVEPAPPAAAQSAPAATSNAQRATDTEVAEHVAQGKRLYLLGHYQEAVAEYRRAYELRADPQFLLDTAEAYRQLGATEQALFYYGRYLAAAPNAPDRELVEDRVAELEIVRAPPPPAPALIAPGPVKAKNRPAPVWRRWWVWTAVGVALGASITAAALTSRSSSPSIPATDLGDRKFY